jgi:hypothetical protein
MPDNAIVNAIWIKVEEQIERTEHLIRLIPPDCIEWSPQGPCSFSDFGHLLGHLLDCMAGFCAVFNAAFPGQFAGILELRSLPVNHSCKSDEAINRVRAYTKYIEQGFKLCQEDDLRRELPTIFAIGESLTTLLLGNLEHLINHKYQLFVYLKMLGIPVRTQDLYCWRGEADRSGPG